jgi:hypothetical protein
VTLRTHRRRYRLLLPVLVTVAAGLLVAPAAGAHAPLGVGDNESLATATAISDPTKSWAVYARLHEGGEAQYYRLEAKRGETIPLQLFRSPAEDGTGFVPSLVVMGPGMQDGGTVPPFIERPAGAGAAAVPGAPSRDVTYEPFSPSAMREVARTTLTASQDGTYYVAVYGNARGGRYGLAVGSRESFTLSEWLTVPLFFATVYAWEGRPLWLVYLPAALVVAAGVVLLRRRRAGRHLDLAGWTASIAGLLFIASGVTVVVQTVVALSRSGLDPALAVTVFLAALPIALGAFTLWFASHRGARWTAGARFALAALGVAGLVLWAGWLCGPALALVAALLPPWRSSSSS